MCDAQTPNEGKTMTTVPARGRKPLLCRLNLHHKWHMEHAVGTGPFRRCVKCGKDDPGSFVERTAHIIPG